MSIPKGIWGRLKELTDTTNMFSDEDRDHIEHMDFVERKREQLKGSTEQESDPNLA